VAYKFIHDCSSLGTFARCHCTGLSKLVSGLRLNLAAALQTEINRGVLVIYDDDYDVQMGWQNVDHRLQSPAG